MRPSTKTEARSIDLTRTLKILVESAISARSEITKKPTSPYPVTPAAKCEKHEGQLCCAPC